MQQIFATLIAQFKEFYKTLSPMKRLSAIAAGLITLAGFAVMMLMVSGKDNAILFKNINPDQLPVIVDELRRKNIPYQLTDNSTTITVPREILHASQMTLMTELGSSKIGNIGLELFEKREFGSTVYQQKVNYQRALQGELTRAIVTLDAVKYAKVILALPNKKTFLEESEEPSASVVLELHRGKQLSEEQVKGIRFLVSSAVESLDAERVTVVDSNGKLLSQRHDPALGASNQLMELKLKIERQIEDKIEDILSKVVGLEKVISRVDVSLDHTQQSKVEESVDPDRTAIRSLQAEEELLDGARTNPAGVPGSRSNLPGTEELPQVGFNQKVKKEIKTTNYDVPRTVKNITETMGGLKKISVAVLVDGSYVNIKDKPEEKQWQPRTQEEMQKYLTLVKNAIGYDEQRGDMVSVENIQFQREDLSEATQYLSQLERKKLLYAILKWGILAFSLGLLFFVVVRPFMQWITDSFQDSVEDMLPRTIEELEELQTVDNSLPGMSKALPTLDESVDPDKAECELLRDRIVNIIEDDSDKAASAFNLWLVKKEALTTDA